MTDPLDKDPRAIEWRGMWGRALFVITLALVVAVYVLRLWGVI